MLTVKGNMIDADIVDCSMHQVNEWTVEGNWTARGYANSRTGHLADWSTRGLDNLRTSQLADCQLADWMTRRLDISRTGQLAD